MQHVVNLLINTLQLTKLFQAIICLQKLLEYDGSQDAHFKFQNGSNASR